MRQLAIFSPIDGDRRWLVGYTGEPAADEPDHEIIADLPMLGLEELLELPAIFRQYGMLKLVSESEAKEFLALSDSRTEKLVRQLPTDVMLREVERRSHDND